jgi:hypothetical protein
MVTKEEIMKRTALSGNSLTFLMLLAIVAGLLLAGPVIPAQSQESPAADNPYPPAEPVKLIFIHHSSGENWLTNGNGNLARRLMQNRYFVSDTNYGWGPFDQDVGSDKIGDHTDIGHWYNWFVGPHRDTYLRSLYGESTQTFYYPRLSPTPPGENTIVMFKSCFPNSDLAGRPGDPPTTGINRLRGQDSSSRWMTVANAKGIYKDLLTYFGNRQDKLFIVITAPPLSRYETSSEDAANARGFNNWLVKSWLRNYPHKNVAVFDFYNVLTSNGGSPRRNDLARTTGNHHRWWNGAVQHPQTLKKNVAAYPSDDYDSHPTAAGNRKATAEFIKLLNVYYHRWHD